jgi:hypothetical protein
LSSVTSVKKVKIDKSEYIVEMNVRLSATSGFPVATNLEKNFDVRLYEDDLEGDDKYIDSTCKLLPLQMRDDRLVMYIAAPSQAGKTTFVFQFVNELQKRKKIEKIFVVSDKESDQLDALNPVRMKLDDQLLKFKYDPLKFANCLFIFDDIDSISDKDVRAKVFKMQDRMMKLGGEYKTHLISTYHLISNRQETRYILFETHYIVIFPKTGTVNQFTNLFNNYIGIDKDQQQEIMKQKSRWVCIHKNHPRYYVSQCEVNLL